MVEQTPSSRQDKILFWACFISLVATGFGFTIRGFIIGDWQADFTLTETQKGNLLGAGLWPFAFSIVIFSLIIDKIGYGKAMFFAFLCHALSAVMTIMAKSYEMLYWGTLIFALGSGTIEAAINPAVATMFSREKVKWLNILHAGWPTGIVVAGLIAIALQGQQADWKVIYGMILVPTLLYGIMMFRRSFPIHERVAAGVSYKEMLREVGVLGALIVLGLLVWHVCGSIAPYVGPQVASTPVIVTITLVLAGIYGLIVRSIGRPLFIILLLLMMPLATTELGVDSWITDLMTPAMTSMGLRPGWLLIYTALVMTILRFFAGGIVHRISPIALLAICSGIAAGGLFFLSSAAGIAIFIAATIYAMGKAFFWPTMLGTVAERFPRGGAMTLNFIAGVGALSVGLVGAPALGHLQDTRVDRSIAAYDQANNTALYSTYMGDEKDSALGNYRAVDQTLVDAPTTPPADTAVIHQIQVDSKQVTLAKVAILPVFTMICFILMLFYFKSKGGYRSVNVAEAEAGYAP